MPNETYTVLRTPTLKSLSESIRQRAIPLVSDYTDQRYADSFGQQLGDLGDRNRWDLAGAALQEWKENLLPLLQAVMENGRKEIYKGENIADYHIVRLCYMLGYDKAHAHPTIVVACDGKRFKPMLKRTVKVIHRVSDFALKGFKLLPARIPDLDFKANLAGFPAKISSPLVTEATPGPISLCGQQIFAGDTERLATIGGTIIIDDSYYALTVAHPFAEASYANNPRPESSEAELFTMEWALGSDSESDESDSENSVSSIGTGRIRSDVPQHSVSTAQDLSSRTRDSSSSSDDLVSRGKNKATDDRLLYVQHFDLSMDWATMRLDDPRFFGANEVLLPPQNSTDGHQRVYLERTKSELPEGDVIILDRDEVRHADCTSSVCTGKLKNSESEITLWPIHCYPTLPTGICGSWVLDGRTHEILGPIVAGSEILGETFVLPIADVLESVQGQHESYEVRLPTKTDSLWLAVYFGNIEAVTRLLKAFESLPKSAPKVHVRDPEFRQILENGMTMLHWCALKGYRRILVMLLAAGADVNETTWTMQTPLHLATMLSSDEASFELEMEKEQTVAFLLTQEGIEVNARDGDGNTALMIAESTGFEHAKDLLKKHPSSKPDSPSKDFYQESSASDSIGGALIDGRHTNPTTGWVWHQEAKNYYRQEYDGAQWHIIWAERGYTSIERKSAVDEVLEDQVGYTEFPDVAPGSLGETIRGDRTTDSAEDLDPGYMTRDRRFFTQGRVFAVIFTEPVSTDKSNDSGVAFGDRVFSNIRRFIVVKEGRGFAYACPVSTYGGRATTKRGIDPQTHAIVYVAGTYPQYVPEEQRLQKAPIPVVPSDGTVTLSGASRINFAIHHPIQHTVKVKDLGRVYPDYIPTLVSYARNESGW